MWGRDRTSFFCMWTFSSPTCRLLRWLFPIELSRRSWYKAVDHRCLGLFLDTWFCSTDPYVSSLFSCQHYTVLITVALEWILKLVSVLNFVLLLKDCFGHLGALHFHSAFQVQLVSFCREVYGYFSRGWKKSVVQFSIISWVPFLSSRFDFPLVELLSFSGSVKAYRNSLHFENVFISSLLLNDSDFSKLDLKFKSKSYFPCNLWRYYSIVFWHLLLLMRCLLSA